MSSTWQDVGRLEVRKKEGGERGRREELVTHCRGWLDALGRIGFEKASSGMGRVCDGGGRIYESEEGDKRVRE